MPDLQTLLNITSSYLDDVDLEPLVRAYNFASERHRHQKHRCGSPYIVHLLEVASTLASMKLDLDTIVAGLLHGVLKEEVCTLEELREEFGDSVAGIVEGASRIPHVRHSSRQASQADNIRRLLKAMGADIRVVLLKLADRLQDMSLLYTYPAGQQRRIAQETLDLYAPLAGRLGIDWMKRELEDRGFQYLFPAEYNELVAGLESSTAQREDYVRRVLKVLREKLEEAGIRPLRLLGRPKHLYSIYKKLASQKISLDRVYDKVAFRIIVSTVKECYEAFGVVHGNWAPVPGRIKDYISTPKSNNYQSLHTTVIGPDGETMEIQIRTEEMDRVAQEGVAAHWAYKEGRSAAEDDSRMFRNLKALVQSLQDVEDPEEFLESVRGELYDPDIYVLTPTGEVRELPRASTPIDFAYSIHSAVGDHCVGAKVNGRLVPLRHELQNGDVVEIITSKNQHPRPAWLQLVRTARARTRIRAFLRRAERERQIEEGREACERELKRLDTSLKRLVKTGHIRALIEALNCNSQEELFIRLGTGAIDPRRIGQVLQPREARQEEAREEEDRQGIRPRSRPGSRMVVRVDGMDDLMIKMARCCKPLPGDAIVGYITTGSGVSVHKASCPRLDELDPRRCIPVEWSDENAGSHQAELRLLAEESRNLLGEVTSKVSADEADIVQFRSSRAPEGVVEVDLVVEVRGLDHLGRICQHLRQIPAVLEVRRR